MTADTEVRMTTSPNPARGVATAVSPPRLAPTALSAPPEPVPVSALRASIAGGDLISLIEYRLALVDDINAALASRRAARPIGKQTYRDRAARAHRERMAAATAFNRGEQR